MEEGLFPHSRSMDDLEQMEEERRLCYVGVTRAKEGLYLLHTFRRTLYGESEIREPSRFLHDIPAHLIRDRKRKRAARREGLGLAADRIGATRPRAPALPHVDRGRPVRGDDIQPAAPHFQTGDKVHHDVFGQGVVIESELDGGDERVTVAFAGIGLKRLLASLSPMEKVEG
jgi:DNA helicase-2/ATP-dependent DNA helicase PcrA